MPSQNSFRMFKARGQPGVWFGYAELDGVTYKIDAKHVGKGVGKHFEGTIKRHLKADQQALPLMTPARYGSPEAAAACVMHKGSPCMTCGAIAFNGVVGDGRGTGFDVLGDAINQRTDAEVMRHVKPEEGFDFDDDLPENI